VTGDISGALASLTIATLFDQASSVAAVPGGGCVSAVCGYLALSILLKSIRLSARSHPEDAGIGERIGDYARSEIEHELRSSCWAGLRKVCR
jgi:hypothetical protein